MTNFSRRAFMGVIVLTSFAAGSAMANEAATATSRETIILSISGKLRDGRSVNLTRSDLERLPAARIRTGTPWYDGVQEFEGPRLSDVLNHVGASGEKLHVKALNNYRTEVPVADAALGPILAIRRNGAAMPVRDKGPIFIIYPYDETKALKNEIYFSRSAWQVRFIEIE